MNGTVGLRPEWEDAWRAARIAYRTVSSPWLDATHDREDYLQEAFIEALRAAVSHREYEGGMNRLNWMVFKARGRIYDLIRWRRPHGLVDVPRVEKDLSTHALDADPVPLPAMDTGFGEVVNRVSIQQVMYEAPLSPSERVVLLARYWEEKDWSVIGASLEITESGAYRIGARALTKLRPFLSPQYDDLIPLLLEAA